MPAKASPKSKKQSPYEKLKRAHAKNQGSHLTAEDVEILMFDAAIRDAIFETNIGFDAQPSVSKDFA